MENKKYIPDKEKYAHFIEFSAKFPSGNYEEFKAYLKKQKPDYMKTERSILNEIKAMKKLTGVAEAIDEDGYKFYVTEKDANLWLNKQHIDENMIMVYPINQENFIIAVAIIYDKE